MSDSELNGASTSADFWHATGSSGNSSSPVRPGTIIAHDRFGRGVVERVEGSGMDTKATVRFDNAGIKQLLLRFAKFRVIKED